MTVKISFDYIHHLENSRPTRLKGGIKHTQPKGASHDLSPIHSTPAIIPPINTDIQISQLPIFKLSEHHELSAMSAEEIPKKFNWRHGPGYNDKRKNITTPGNQLLCGSCWAISTAGIIADNHVVAGTVEWLPNLSTTWSLSCYPQNQCKGGNPAKLFDEISKKGIATNNCIDYSWCKENDNCTPTSQTQTQTPSSPTPSSPTPPTPSSPSSPRPSSPSSPRPSSPTPKPKDHFKAKNLNLSNDIPSCGCYDSKSKHYLYYIDPPRSISIGRGDITKDNFALTVKKHILKHGPVQGGFIVYKNFMHGTFTKINGGIYLETGTYDVPGQLRFDQNQINMRNYVGSHAIAVIGWGVAENIIVDNNGTKKTIPFWYCRNSWGTKWGDGGYFKMAMYPFNKISQFDKILKIKTPQGNMLVGGMVRISASKPPVLEKLQQTQNKFISLKKEHPSSYYDGEKHEKGKMNPKYIKSDKSDKSDKSNTRNWKVIILIILGILIGISLIIFTIFGIKALKKWHRIKGRKYGRSGSY